MFTFSINEEIVEFDKVVTKIDAWYDRHTRLWVIQKLNKDGFQVGNAEFIYGKKDAIRVKKELEEEFHIG